MFRTHSVALFRRQAPLLLMRVSVATRCPISTSESDPVSPSSSDDYIPPFLFPILVTYGSCNYDIRRLVQKFRDDALLSPVGTAAPTNGKKALSYASAKDQKSRQTVEGKQSSSFRYELQYPNPGGLQFTRGAQPPQVYKVAGSLGTRTMAVMVRVLPANSFVAVFGDGTLVAFDNGTLNLPGTSTSQLADQSLLAAPCVTRVERSQRLEQEMRQLKKFLRPFAEPKDAMLTLPTSLTNYADATTALPLMSQLSFTTLDELKRSGFDDPPQGGQHEQAVTEASGNNNSKVSSYIDNEYLHTIVLAAPTPAEMIPFAFALAEVVQLRALDHLLLPLTQSVGKWKEHVHQHGALPMSLHDARKVKAQALRMASRQSKMGMTRHRVFWEGHLASSRTLFQDACVHFEVYTMHDELKDRMDALTHTLAYLCEEAHADTNHRLEWVIIVLIAVEVLISLHMHNPFGESHDEL